MKRKIDFEGATKTLQGEEWKDVTGYEGIYKVSNLGRVKRLKRRFDDGRKSIMRERILLASKDKDGYFSVALSKNGKSTTMRLHRVVLSAFVPNVNNLPMVNHINEIRDDNRLENLEWCDAKYNNSYGKAIEKRKVAQQRYYNKSIKVHQYTLRGKYVKGFHSIVEASMETGISKTDIQYALKGKMSRAGNFQWIFNDNIPPKEIDAIKRLTHKNVKVAQYSLNGEYIRLYNSVKDAKKSTGITTISSCCIGKAETAGRYVWRYVEDGYTPLTSIPITWTTKEKRVYQYTKTGECVGIYESCTEAAKSVNGSASNICGCCLGYYKTSKGYIWSYNNDN